MILRMREREKEKKSIIVTANVAANCCYYQVSSVCIILSVWNEWENNSGSEQMILIVFHMQSNNLYKLVVVVVVIMCAAGMQCQKHFHLYMNHHTPVFSRSQSFTLTYKHTYVLPFCIISIVHRQAYTHTHTRWGRECMVWLLSDMLCDSNAGECDFVHMPSKCMIGLCIILLL